MTGTKLFAPSAGDQARHDRNDPENMFQQVWMGGGEGANVLMSTPGVIRRLRTSSLPAARISQRGGGCRNAVQGATAKGAVTFGKRSSASRRAGREPVAANLRASREYPAGDFDYIQLSYQRGYETEMLAKTGLSEKWMMSVDWQVDVTVRIASARSWTLMKPWQWLRKRCHGHVRASE